MRTKLSVPLLLATLAALIFGGLHYRSERMRRGLEMELNRSALRISQLTEELATGKTLRRDLAVQLTELDASLGEAKTKLVVSEARNVQLGRELAGLNERMLAGQAQEKSLRDELAGLQAELSSRPGPAASQDVVSGYESTIVRLEEKLASALAAVPAVPAVLLTTSRSRAATVVSVGPSSAFVVINYGANHGALPEQRLMILRGTDTLATVHISDVRENHSIAQVRPGSLQAALHKGDFAVLTD